VFGSAVQNRFQSGLNPQITPHGKDHAW